ncbi:4Fe-4S binding protein [Thermosulfurimonas dismutans]|uniref:Iron-sulfur cluster-binding protein n=1 Tax=Thermosulfurimonas dismutans TaxID=999894 RepID=A0A179D477_9BACT|nr:4Fe-4S binding protein [Thermosulfurimonas dismutans]OAQ20857.1 iron-sulfur cluster-binding protein [Thermosulfurimonas dismutans]
MARLKVLDTDRCVGCQLCMFACQRRTGTGGIAECAIHVRSRGGLSRGLTVIVCRACEDPPCLSVCPTGALLKRKGGGVVLSPKKCIGCGFCVEACPLKAIFWNEETQKPVICMHCGYCAEYCPHNVLAVEEDQSARQ